MPKSDHASAQSFVASHKAKHQKHVRETTNIRAAVTAAFEGLNDMLIAAAEADAADYQSDPQAYIAALPQRQAEFLATVKAERAGIPEAVEDVLANTGH